MRLIDADAFIQMMEEKCDPESTLDPWVLSVCRGGVKMMPTVDAVPVKHERWIIRTRHEHYPSGRAYEEIVCPFCGKVDHNGDGDFCGYCGAKMDRKDGGDG